MGLGGVLRESLHYWNCLGTASMAIPTRITYMYRGGTDVIWVLSMQKHTPSVHWAQHTQSGDGTVVIATVEVPGGNSIERFF